MEKEREKKTEKINKNETKVKKKKKQRKELESQHDEVQDEKRMKFFSKKYLCKYCTCKSARYLYHI